MGTPVELWCWRADRDMPAWMDMCATLLDPVLGPLTGRRPDVGIALMALAVAVLSVLIRRVLANQALVRRAAADRKRLRALMRLALAQGNMADVKRYRRTWRMIRRRTRRGRWLAGVLSLVLLGLGLDGVQGGWATTRRRRGSRSRSVWQVRHRRRARSCMSSRSRGSAPTAGFARWSCGPRLGSTGRLPPGPWPCGI